jgi:hypothetical protein
MLDSVADLAEEKEGPDALGRLGELNAMLSTAVTRLEKLEERVTQLRNGVFEQLLEDGINDDSDSDSSSESETGGGHEDRTISGNSQELRQDCSQLSETSLAELRGTAEEALSEMPYATERLDDIYSALAQSLASGCSSR